MTTLSLPSARRSVNADLRVDLPFPTTADAAVADPHAAAAAGVAPGDAVDCSDVLPDLATLRSAVAYGRLAARIDRNPALPETLHRAVLDSAIGAARKRHEPDALFLPAHSRLVSVSMSLQRREGHLLNAAVLAAIDACPTLTLLPTLPLLVTRDVLDQIEAEGLDACMRFDLDPVGEAVRRLSVDAMFVDHARNVAVSLELKRGGRLGGEHAQWLSKDLAAGALCIRHHVRGRGFHVRRGEAGVVVFREDAGLQVTGDWAMTVAAFDERFGTEAAAMVEAVQRAHAAAVRLVLRPLQIAALREAEVGPRPI